MTPPSDDKDLNKAIALLTTQVEKTGVASIKVGDGEVFMFSVERLAQIVIDAANAGQKNITIFVKTGQLIQDVQLN